jgi:hypothetical protein
MLPGCDGRSHSALSGVSVMPSTRDAVYLWRPVTSHIAHEGQKAQMQSLACCLASVLFFRRSSRSLFNDVAQVALFGRCDEISPERLWRLCVSLVH